MALLLRNGFTRSTLLASGRRAFADNAGSPRKASNVPLVLGLAGVTGLGAYAYLQWAEANSSKARAALIPALDKEKFVDFPLKKIEPYNHNTTRFTFALPEGTATLLPVASCVVVKSPDPAALVGDNGKPIIRPYTPVSLPDRKGEVQFLIKKYENGKASPFIHNMKVGDKLSIKGPIPKIPYKPNEFDEVGMIAGGSGITPMYQIINHALSNPEDKTKIKLIFGNVTPADILLREEFDTLKAKHPDRFDVLYVVDKGDKSWKGPTGFITKDLIQKFISPPSKGEKVKVLICGPDAQVVSIAGKKDGFKQGDLGGVLKDIGYTAEQVYKF